MKMYYANGVNDDQGYKCADGTYTMEREYGRDHDGTAFCGAWGLRGSGILVDWDFDRTNLADRHGLTLERGERPFYNPGA